MANIWQSGPGLSYRLVADDGEVLDAVNHSYHGWTVQSTGREYVTMEQAKAASERSHAQTYERSGK